MVDHVKLLQVLVDFAQTLVRTYRLDDVLPRLCADVTGLLAVDGAGVMLEDRHGDLRFIAASNDDIGGIEQLQVETGEGPCVTAHRTGTAVLIDDLETTAQMPDFTPRALAAGIRAVYSFPMRIDDVNVGALNLYRAAAGSLDEDAVTAAQLLADLATTYLLSVDAVDRTTRLASQLQQALDSRIVIEQAKGKLSAIWQVDVTTAFERLRRHARDSQRLLHDLAADVVDGRLHPDSITPAGPSALHDRR